MSWEGAKARQPSPDLISPQAAEVLRGIGGVSVVVDSQFFRQTVNDFIDSLPEDVPVKVYDLHAKDTSKGNLTKKLTAKDAPGVVLVLSDCASGEWYSGEMPSMLQGIAATKNVALLPLLPPNLINRTAIREADIVQVDSNTPVTNNKELPYERVDLDYYFDDDSPPKPKGTPIPFVRKDIFDTYIRLIAGEQTSLRAACFDTAKMRKAHRYKKAEDAIQPEIVPEALIRMLVATAGPTTRRLASILAAVPITFDVVDRIRAEMMPETTEAHFAHLAFSGLLYPVSKSEPALFDYVSGVRGIILDGGMISTSMQALTIAANVFAEHLPELADVLGALSSGNFRSISLDHKANGTVIEFAKVATAVWKRINPRLRDDIARLEQQIQAHPSQKKAAELGKPLRHMSTEAIERDHGATFLRQCIAKLDINSFTTFNDLQRLDGFEIAFRSMALFLAENLEPGGIVENLSTQATLFSTQQYPIKEISWMDGNERYNLTLHYLTDEERTLKTDPARICLDVSGTTPIFAYEYTYRRVGAERQGSSFGGVTNGSSQRGFVINARDWRTSIHGINDNKASTDTEETTKRIVATMQLTAQMLLRRYEEVTGQRLLDSSSITEI